MNADDLRRRFSGLHVFGAKGERALNKPLLALWAIGRCLKGEERMTPYQDVEQALNMLLTRFGPVRKSIHPEYAFGRLRNDRIWEIQGKGEITQGSGGDVHVSSLRKQDARGGFPKKVFATLQENKSLAIEIAYRLVDFHFPNEPWDVVFRAVGIEPEFVEEIDQELKDKIEPEFVYTRRRRRNSAFSRLVLDAYRHQCAVCGFSVRLDDDPLALEGAHIRWHRARGPDQVQNGLALCALHHRLFDAGAFTVSSSTRKVIVATSVGGTGFDGSLGCFHRKKISPPKTADDFPNPKYLEWHHRQVFRSPYDVLVSC